MVRLAVEVSCVAIRAPRCARVTRARPLRHLSRFRDFAIRVYGRVRPGLELQIATSCNLWGRWSLGVVLPSGLRCQHSLAGRLGERARHDGVDDGVVDVRQALN